LHLLHAAPRHRGLLLLLLLLLQLHLLLRGCRCRGSCRGRRLLLRRLLPLKLLLPLLRALGCLLLLRDVQRGEDAAARLRQRLLRQLEV
jgi:hypothetical protein